MLKDPLLKSKADKRLAKAQTGALRAQKSASGDDVIVTTISTTTKEDLESGKAETYKYQVTRCCDRAKSVGKTDVLLFVASPDNWATLVILGCFAWTIWVFWLDGTLPIDGKADQNIWLDIWGQPSTNPDTGRVTWHHHWPSVFAGIMCTGGLAIGVLFQFLKIQLLDQISQFRALNKEYNAEVKKLAEQCDVLNDTNEQLKLDLGTFEDLRTGLEEYAKKNGKDFTEIMEQTQDIFKGISASQDTSERIRLQEIVAQYEFWDHQEGVSEKEWKRFHSALPTQYKAKVDQLGLTFEQAAKGKENANVEDMKEVLDLLLKEVAQAEAS